MLRAQIGEGFPNVNIENLPGLPRLRIALLICASSERSSNLWTFGGCTVSSPDSKDIKSISAS
jgi:hypothetical protein